MVDIQGKNGPSIVGTISTEQLQLHLSIKVSLLALSPYRIRAAHLHSNHSMIQLPADSLLLCVSSPVHTVRWPPSLFAISSHLELANRVSVAMHFLYKYILFTSMMYNVIV